MHNADPAMLISRAGKRVRIGDVDDARAIASLEVAAQQQAFVIPWPEERHRRAIASADFRYFICDGPAGRDAQSVPRAFAILGGLTTAHRAIEIIRIVVDGRRFGLGGDLLDVIVRYAFGELKAHRIWSDTFADNVPVRRMARHYGFTEEGMLRDALVFDGRYRSVVFLGLLEDESAAIAGPPRKIGAIT